MENSRFSLKNIFIICTAILAMLVNFSCSDKKYERKNLFTPVEVYKVKSKYIRDFIFTTGEIKGINNAKVYSFYNGILKRIFVNQGSYVNKGTPLFLIDRSLTGVYSLGLVVNSPISGIVSNIYLETGNQIIANQSVLATVVNNRNKIYETMVTDTDADNIKPGQDVNIIIVATGMKLKGKIISLSPSLNKNKGTIKVKVVMNSPKAEIFIGMLAKAKIFTGKRRKAFLVPCQSVIFSQSGHYLYKVNKGKAVIQRVQIGRILNDKIEILKGVNSSDLIITKGQYFVQPNFKVSVYRVNNIKTMLSKIKKGVKSENYRKIN